MPICLPLSADNWDTHQALDKQFGKWFGSDSPLEYAHLHAFNVSCRYAQSVPVWLTSVSCSSSSTCLSSCLASASTATQNCSSNTYISIACSEWAHKGAILIVSITLHDTYICEWPIYAKEYSKTIMKTVTGLQAVVMSCWLDSHSYSLLLNLPKYSLSRHSTMYGWDW